MDIGPSPPSSNVTTPTQPINSPPPSSTNPPNLNTTTTISNSNELERTTDNLSRVSIRAPHPHEQVVQSHEQSIPYTPISQLCLPSLTPSKSIGSSSLSSSPPDSIPSEDQEEPDVFSEDEEEQEVDKPKTTVETCRTPAHTSSNFNGTISHSEPGPIRKPIGRKRSVSGLVALRYRSTAGRHGQIDEEERGMLALDLDAYINSTDHRDSDHPPQTGALSPSSLFPTLLTQLKPTKPQQRSDLTIITLPHPSEWVFGNGTGPGNAHRGFIPGVLNDDEKS